MIFVEGPRIRVTVEYKEGQCKRVSLQLAHQFEYVCVGRADPALEEQLVSFLQDYGKRRPGCILLDLSELPPFRARALLVLQQLPFGEVLSYQELAARAGSPKAARAAGSACHHNPYPLFIPCHRVISKGGRLGGFAYASEIKRRLLEFENC